MPRTAASLRLTDSYRGRLLQVRQRAVQAVRVAWGTVAIDDFERTFAIWAAVAAGTLTQAQIAAVVQTDTYFAAYLSSELNSRIPPRGIDPAERSGTAANGRPVLDMLALAAQTVRLSRAQGVAAAAALTRGLARAERLTATEVLAASRSTLDDLITSEDRVVGWRRTTSATACVACLGSATGAIQRDAEVLEAHEHCRCTKEPVVRGVRETARRPTGEDIFDDLTPAQQDALFAGNGGGDIAELLRTGQLSLADTVATAPHAHRDDGIRIASAATLRRRAEASTS